MPNYINISSRWPQYNTERSGEIQQIKGPPDWNTNNVEHKGQ